MINKIFKDEIGHIAYLGLIEAVREFDIKAAEYLLGYEIGHLRSFMLSNNLGGAFTWDDTKQGFWYWKGIQGKLKEAGYYG